MMGEKELRKLLDDVVELERAGDYRGVVIIVKRVLRELLERYELKRINEWRDW